MARKRARRERTGLIGFLIRWVRRIQRLALVASLAAGVYRWWQSGPGRKRGLAGGPPESDGGGGAGRPAPIGGPRSPSALRATATPAPEPELVGAVTTSVATVDPSGSTWVAPLENGTCPPTHPVKVNESSGIYHVPGGRFYDRTVAGRCYANADDAATDGFRPAKA
jgi:hypothetical protein